MRGNRFEITNKNQSSSNIREQGCVWVYLGNTDLFEVFSNFKVILQRVVTFDLCVAVVDDGQEHVEQYEEDEEHIQEEVDGTEDEVSILQSIEVEISQDDTEQGEAVNIKKT